MSTALAQPHAMPFGAELQPGGGVRFRLWAPTLAEVVLETAHGPAWRAHAMARSGEGWHEAVRPEARAGTRYRYRLPDGRCVPDPASRRNPEDVHGPSEVVDPDDTVWRHRDWTGRPWHEAVICELHVGSFTPEGSFAAAQARLAELAATGFTAVELMPIADFPGRRNWGYDGVLPFAPDASYGTPAELRAFVDAAHGLGLMVLLDVVYNHFGPEGNGLHACCPAFFNAAHPTPWGAAINFDGAQSRTVRDFFIHNALYWVEEFGIDGLRLDAVHAIHDASRPGIVEEICAALHDGPGRRRAVHVVLENDLNQARLLERDAQGRPLAATAQWNDDLHHAAHVLLTGEADGYYADYAEHPLEKFGLALAQGFIYTGQPSAFRRGEARGEACGHLPLTAFVSCLQTHDQIGNRAFGERIDALVPPERRARVQAARACVLLSPHVPMLFMGEEFAASSPFLYFCDFGPELAAAVSAGRRAEFAHFAAFAGEAARARIPDPNGEAAFADARLRWEERAQPPHDARLRQTRALLAVRRDALMPLLGGASRDQGWSCEGEVLRVAWALMPQGAAGPVHLLHLVANFGTEAARVVAPPGRVIHAIEAVPGGPEDAAALLLAPGGVCAALEEPADA